MKLSEAIDRLQAGDTVWVKGKVKAIDEEEPLPVVCNISENGVWLYEEDEISLTESDAEKVEAHLAEHWNEDVGDVLWWNFPVEEPPYCGTPLDEHFPKHKTHFTTIDMPTEIEKPKRWVVSHEAGKFFEKFTGNGTSRAWVVWKNQAYIFTDRAKAEAVAVLGEGTVEEV